MVEAFPVQAHPCCMYIWHHESTDALCLHRKRGIWPKSANGHLGRFLCASAFHRPLTKACEAPVACCWWLGSAFTFTSAMRVKSPVRSKNAFCKDIAAHSDCIQDPHELPAKGKDKVWLAVSEEKTSLEAHSCGWLKTRESNVIPLEHVLLRKRVSVLFPGLLHAGNGHTLPAGKPLSQKEVSNHAIEADVVIGVSTVLSELHTNGSNKEHCRWKWGQKKEVPGWDFRWTTKYWLPLSSKIRKRMACHEDHAGSTLR